MLGFIAEYTGKACGYIVEAGECAWDDTVSAYDRFVDGYNSVTTPPINEEPKVQNTDNGEDNAKS